MGRFVRPFVAFSALLLLGACVEEPMLPAQYYAAPEPAPLLPYMGPSANVTVQRSVTHRRVVRHRHRRRHHRVYCHCTPG